MIPTPNLVFRPMIETPLNKVRVVMIGTEPNPLDPSRSDGLAFSYSKKVKDLSDLPIATRALVEEAMFDVDIKMPKSGSLAPWAHQGVLLWNRTPTVKAGYAFSHMTIGWEKLTREILETVYLVNPKAIFVFFGDRRDMRAWLPYDAITLSGPGPSANACDMEFYGKKYFTRINNLLDTTKQGSIDWSLK